MLFRIAEKVGAGLSSLIIKPPTLAARDFKSKPYHISGRVAAFNGLKIGMALLTWW